MADYIYHTSIPAALETLSDFVYSLSAKNGYSKMVAGTTNDAGAEPNQFMFFFPEWKK